MAHCFFEFDTQQALDDILAETVSEPAQARRHEVMLELEKRPSADRGIAVVEGLLIGELRYHDGELSFERGIFSYSHLLRYMPAAILYPPDCIARAIARNFGLEDTGDHYQVADRIKARHPAIGSQLRELIYAFINWKAWTGGGRPDANLPETFPETKRLDTAYTELLRVIYG